MRQKPGRTDNIIPFPGLPDRLLKMGIEHLEAGRYKEAVHLLSQAKELDEDDPGIGTALLVGLYESGEYADSKVLAEELLQKGIGSYYEVMDMYVMVLIQMNAHDEVVATLQALFEERQVPPDKEEHYLTLLKFSEKVLESGQPEAAEEIPYIQLFSGGDRSIYAGRIAELQNRNIKPYLDQLLAYLENGEDPFIQTMVLHLLKEHGFSQAVPVKKLGFEGMFSPELLPEPFEMELFSRVILQLEHHVEQDNPTLYEQIKTIAERHFFTLFPFEPFSDVPETWAAAYQAIGESWYGRSGRLEELREEYGSKLEDWEEVSAFIARIEEISSLNL